jgi:DNA helicase-2/ATP-dependent DNA helicase PcrA
LDFDDFINYTLYIFKNYKESKLKWQQRIEYVMVDEFQDVSSKQYALANILSKFHKNLFILGDPDQTIYSWRGARVDFILNFDKAFQDVKTIIMDKKYRSSPEILSASISLIRKNKNRMDKELKPIKSSKVQVLYNHSKTSKKESEWIVKQIKLLLDMGKSLKDIVILYRAHYLSRSVEESFIKEDIKYTMYSGIEFYKRKEIKDVLCYLRMIIWQN